MTNLAIAPVVPLLDHLLVVADAHPGAMFPAAPAWNGFGEDDRVRVPNSRTMDVGLDARLKAMPLAVARETGGRAGRHPVSLDDAVEPSMRLG